MYLERNWNSKSAALYKLYLSHTNLVFNVIQPLLHKYNITWDARNPWKVCPAAGTCALKSHVKKKNLTHYPMFNLFISPGFNSSMSALWLVDLERACSLLIGHCLGDMLLGSSITEDEKQCRPWLDKRIFSNGLENNCDGKSGSEYSTHPIALDTFLL